MRGEGEGSSDACQAYGGVRISESAHDRGEDFGEVRGEGVAMILGQNGD